MPKRHGNLYPKICALEALHQGYLKARRGKRNRGPVARFEADLGAELAQLAEELQAGTYAPLPYRQFYVYEPKKRLISAPAFHDVVVQHAIYAVIYEIFDAGFIHDNYGCRVGKGTHRGASRAQQFLREVEPESFTLQMDIRKFYYRIDRTILRRLLERKIKDARFVDLIMMFADMPEPLGLPIGNLLSQLFALIYLDPLDHFVKRDLKCARYVRYVDDFIVFGIASRVEADALRQKIGAFLDENLHLEFSRYTIAPTRRGVNFVGFRTWRKTRFVRRHSLHTFSRSLKRSDVPSLISIMGNARHSATYKHFCQRIRDERPDLIPQLPENHRQAVMSCRPQKTEAVVGRRNVQVLRPATVPCAANPYPPAFSPAFGADPDNFAKFIERCVVTPVERVNFGVGTNKQRRVHSEVTSHLEDIKSTPVCSLSNSFHDLILTPQFP